MLPSVSEAEPSVLVVVRSATDGGSYSRSFDKRHQGPRRFPRCQPKLEGKTNHRVRNFVMTEPRTRLQWTRPRLNSPPRLVEVVRLEFLGCALTAYTDEEVWLDVLHFAEFLRDVDGRCAFCHGDPCGEDSPPESLIRREMAACQSYAPFETCPCCDGRAT